MIYYLFITALTVSIDSFACGLSLSLGKRKILPLILIVTITVFIMCCISNYATILLKDVLTEESAVLGGFILIILGIINLLKKENAQVHSQKNFILQSLTAGFAVGLDGAFANLSLSLMGINAFYVPLTIAITHGLMIGASAVLTKTTFAKKLSKCNFIAPLILIGLGIYKIIVFYI